jgi:hypothetical protein
MSEDNLFTKVKNAIRGQKSSFCSRSTSVTPLETLGLEGSIQYTNCQGETTEIPYGDITITGGYIPDCVQGGSPISVNVKEIPVKIFVQYGTTDCDTPTPPPPPGPNLIIISCSKGESFIVNPSGFTLTKDGVYLLSFNNNVISDECYTIGYTTSQSPIDSIKNEPQLTPSCGECP